MVGGKDRMGVRVMHVLGVDTDTMGNVGDRKSDGKVKELAFPSGTRLAATTP